MNNTASNEIPSINVEDAEGVNMTIIEKSGTFILNKNEPIHRWYSYMEGYSSCFVEREILGVLKEYGRIETLYDPFNGTGTTGLVGAMCGIQPFYSETNPFMQFVAETKLNSAPSRLPSYALSLLQEYTAEPPKNVLNNETTWDGFEKYFDIQQLQQILSIKAWISTELDQAIRDLLMLALSAILVKSSKMTRRGDLRYATPREYHPQNVFKLFVSKLSEIMEDLPTAYEFISYPLVKVSDDAKDNSFSDFFDCVITSPPYLNGTNYIRNTKLELKLNGFIQSEDDLPAFHTKGIVAGINNVSKRMGSKPILPVVQDLVDEVTRHAYDERIPKMIAGYFFDMETVISALARSLKAGGIFILDIGDSQFGGVHIPTHEILSSICTNYGFEKYSEDIIRQRKSKNSMMLSQRIMRFRMGK